MIKLARTSPVDKVPSHPISMKQQSINLIVHFMHLAKWHLTNTLSLQPQSVQSCKDSAPNGCSRLDITLSFHSGHTGEV